ncbi:NAD(P)-binding protein [Aulographum hederae CBS 113979]|uniref:NAD(P)-binding protein n=1 Tax=Aulographum hederae CBS 113979 TaxID=1176131 RepID=A0A6G1H3Y7_9PEZI|nr:NAD(P)-binding protein [Aulographum hederae CBS 113979]
MPAPVSPFQPYASVHVKTNGPGDARPSSFQVVQDEKAIGALKGRTVLITGCSSGIGVETARALYETGATLFLTARDMPKLEKVIEEIVSTAKYNKDGPRPQPIEIDLSSLDSVRKGAADFKSKSKQLNILINNAGVMACPFGKTQDGFETQIGTNHFAHFLLFAEVKDLLLQSAKESGIPSRGINVSSAGHRAGGILFDNMNFENGGYEKFRSYGQSKTANIYMANSIHRHFADQGLHGLSLHPGAIMTELARHMTAEDEKLFGPEGMKGLLPIMKNPSQGAATTVWAAVSKRFDDADNGGRYLAEVGESGPVTEGGMVPGGTGYCPHAYDEEAEEKLWKVTQEILKVQV